MTVRVVVETVDSMRRRLAVEVPAAEVSAEIERTYAELGRAAKVPGFRPGRVPRQVLERMFGDRVRAEAFGRLIRDSYEQALLQERIDVVGQPEIVKEQAQPGASLRYSATVEVKPEVVAERYRGLVVERPAVTVTDADVTAFLERLRQSLAPLRPIDDRAHSEHGDVVVVDYTARVEGRVLGRGEKREVVIGANGFPPEFDRALLGAGVGAVLDFSAAYPADHPAADLAAKVVHFHVQVGGLFRREVPALDDEFAKDHGECSTLAELRQRVSGQLQAEAGRYADEAVRNALLAELSRVHDVPVPRAMVEHRTDALVEEARREWRRARVQPRDQAAALLRLREELQPRAREQVKIALLLEAIVRQEGIEVSDADLEARIAALAAEAGSGAESVRALYADPDMRRQLRTRMLQARAVETMVQSARITGVQAPPHIAGTGENR